MITKTVCLGTTICAFIILLAGCSVFESTETKQIKACAEDVKSGLKEALNKSAAL